MSQEGGARRPRRWHLLAAAAILLVIFAVGLGIAIWPGSSPTVGDVARKTTPSSVTPFGRAFARGIEAMRLGDAEAAAAAFDQARSINPHVSEAHINLGFAYLAMKKSGEAATAFDRALTIDPRKTNAYYGLGAALEAAGDRPGAIGAMRTYVHLAAEDDPFKRKALAALWEWEAAERSDTSNKTQAEPPKTENGAPQGGGEPGAEARSATLAARPVASRDAPAPAPLPAIEETPDALNAPAGTVTIVNVWASWCGPCRTEMPSLQAFAAALDQSRYRLIGLNVDRDRDFAREFIRDTGVSFGNFWDGKGVFARNRFQVESYPQTLFLDANGALLARVNGAREWPADAAQATVAEILDAGRKAKEPK